ncbi:hypothetical protein, partial [Bartonella sp. AA81SXKL]|uniref:hypothetical protein n=1 Tax=Bartonella sp. AA81SXKL TaxID=3243438 RepID=UPI0035CF07E8
RHLYAYEKSRRALSFSLPAQNVVTTLALRGFIRSILIPFLKSFCPHPHLACHMQANDFD